ncbi:MAG: helix-turn-helix domain-containing protein [Planctomycetota bacterium]|jgi:DNA-binding XRE family transcriptional regulator
MGKVPKEKREQAFRMRLARKTFTEIAGVVGVSTKTLSRWENGWIDRGGREHSGWRQELETSWRENIEETPDYGIIVREERIKTLQELARMAMAKLKEMFPHIKGTKAVDAKALMSEFRELAKLVAQEKGELSRGPSTVVAVKNDITLADIQDRYVRSVEAEVVDRTPKGELPDDVDNHEGDAERGGDAEPPVEA